MQITREQLDRLIKDKDWTAVEQADVSELTDMSGLFKHIDGIENLDLSGWDTKNVTDMSNMFSYSKFNHPLDSFNTSSVTNMSNMFYGSEFNHPLDSFDTSNVTDMNHMFYDSKFNHPLDSFDTSNVTDMRSMFSYSDFNHPLDSFDTSKIKNMSYMFSGSVFNHPLDSFDTSNVKDMKGMFLSCKYTKPMLWAENISLDTRGAEEIVERYERNWQLDEFLSTGKGDLDMLLNSFEGDDEILSQIKLVVLELNQDSSPVSTPRRQGRF